MHRLGGLVVIAPARRAGDSGSIPCPGENFSLKLLIYDLPDGHSENSIFIKIIQFHIVKCKIKSQGLKCEKKSTFMK